MDDFHFRSIIRKSPSYLGYGGDFLIYIVQSGDTLFSIARQTQVPVWKITWDNGLMDRDRLAEGQALLVVPPGESENMRPGMEVSGYAYPFVEPYILEQSYIALNELLVFSYGFTFEGELIPPAQDDLWMVESAWTNGIRPMLVLTPFSGGGFNNQLIKVIVENLEIQQKVINSLFDTVQERGYAGVSVDFEYILPQDRIPFAEFVGRLRDAMHEGGYRVSVAVAPKTSAGQKGLLYEGMDYRLLGENADTVFLMTYEWGYTYGPPMAVAPIKKVREVVEYAVTEIPPEKLILGIPNYGYDWQLPYERGLTRALTIGNEEAPVIAAENGAEIQFSENSMSPWFTYTKSGMAHEVWFEDVRSIEAKLALAREYGLFGVGYWNLMRPFRANWVLLEK